MAPEKPLGSQDPLGLFLPKRVLIDILDNPTAPYGPPEVTMGTNAGGLVLRDLLGLEPRNGRYAFTADDLLRRLDSVTEQQISARSSAPCRGVGEPVPRRIPPTRSMVTTRRIHRCMSELRELASWARRNQCQRNCYAGADVRYRVPIRIIAERATHALFARTLFIRELQPEKRIAHDPEFTVIHAPNFHADPEIDGTNSDAFVIIHFGKRLVLIGGTAYSGEMKKSIFTIMNYLLPQQGVMAMHPITHIPNMVRSGVAGHPRYIIMLTCDAFGVLPPIAKLSPAQAMYHFLAGYTAKVAGIEAGVKEPRATFSPPFRSPPEAAPPPGSWSR